MVNKNQPKIKICYVNKWFKSISTHGHHQLIAIVDFAKNAN